MPHTFRHARHHPWIVGQDCILRAGFQPALVGLFTSDSGGFPTRRTQRVPPQFLYSRFWEKYVALGNPARSRLLGGSSEPRSPAESRRQPGLAAPPRLIAPTTSFPYT